MQAKYGNTKILFDFNPLPLFVEKYFTPPKVNFWSRHWIEYRYPGHVIIVMMPLSLHNNDADHDQDDMLT